MPGIAILLSKVTQYPEPKLPLREASRWSVATDHGYKSSRAFRFSLRRTKPSLHMSQTWQHPQ